MRSTGRTRSTDVILQSYFTSKKANFEMHVDLRCDGLGIQIIAKNEHIVTKTKGKIFLFVFFHKIEI